MTPASAPDEPTRSLEIELTFDVDAETHVPSWAGLDGVAFVDPPERRELDAQYFDVDGLTLGRAGYAVRRRTGGPDEGWHIKGPKDADGARLEQHWPLGDAGTPPDELVRAVTPIAPTAGEPGALRRIARIRNDRHAALLRDAAGSVIAEFVDDHVTALDELRGVETRWREWEFELGPAAPSGRADRAALLAAAAEIAYRAGARPAVSDSKLARTLGV
ncbi:MAG: CYTH domain-containing protein [Microbacterium sp.]|uniref:CYTH domain-containing protein n=1 Tax=Microbacterium sp. TaxID=51671 RepID=UPI001AD53113|nr:CYTH domain-containing protein [Microbacterium sp.]MBN9177022.1 CYTH domain-containing protein [Microbacterium sp.]